MLGMLYAQGKETQRDFQQALRWFGVAESQGSADAGFELGYMNAKGLGVTQNLDEAIRWFEQAAEKSPSEYKVKLGVMYANGQVVPKNLDKAVFWFEQAERQEAKSGQMFVDAIRTAQASKQDIFLPIQVVFFDE